MGVRSRAHDFFGSLLSPRPTPRNAHPPTYPPHSHGRPSNTDHYTIRSTYFICMDTYNCCILQYILPLPFPIRQCYCSLSLSLSLSSSSPSSLHLRACLRAKVMISTRVEDPGIAFLALAECGGNVSLASKRAADGRYEVLLHLHTPFAIAARYR